LSACLLGSTALVAHADEGTVPVVSGTAAQAVVVTPTAQAVGSAPTALVTAPAAAALTSAPTAIPAPVAPAPVSPAASVASAATASREATMQATAAPTTPAPTVPAPETEAPVAPAPALQDAPADAPAAATETPVSAPQQQPTPAASASTSDGVTATVKGVLDLKPGEKPTVGTTVKWTITLHNSTSHAVDVLKALLHLEPGESGDVEDNLAPTTLTQADLDAGRVTYTSRYDIVSSDGRQIVRAQGALDLPKTAPTTTTTPAPTTTPTTPAPTPSTTASDRVTASVRGVLDLKPGEKPTVGTTVKWVVTFLHPGLDTVKIDGTSLELAPGRSGYVEDTTKPSTITQADLDAGVVRYESEFGVDAPKGDYTIPARGELTLPTPTPTPTPTPAPAPAAEHPSLTGRIAGEFVLPAGGRVLAGTPVKWTATLTNAGDVALSDVHVTDSGEHTTLAVGETKDLTFYTTAAREDIARGYTFDTFRASGRTPSGSTVDFRLLRTLDLPSDEGRAAVTTTGAFELTAGEQVEAGTRVSWTVTVTNTTGADLHDLSVDGDARSETIAVLTPGETRQLHLETTVTAQDLAENRTRLVADLVGRTGDSPFSTHASGELAIGTEHPRLEASSTGAFDLEPGHPVTVGSKIVWTVTAKNTGDVSFLDLDPQGPGSIAAGETKVYQVADTVTQEDLDAGVVRRIFTATGARKGHPDYVSAPYLGVLPIPSTVDGVTTGTPTETGTGTETGTSTGTTTDTATAAGTTSVTGPSVSSATGDEAAPAGFVALAGAAGARPGAAAGSAPTAASPAAASPTPRRGGASAAHLAQTGVDASSALPAAGVLGLLGALGMLLGARRRRNRAAD
jgi:LPXTG-motif cell wall-anchored protein